MTIDIENIDPKEDKNQTDEEFSLKFDARFDWLDQFRGLCALLYTIAILTWGLSGDLLDGILPVGPTYYNHGYAISFKFFGNFDSNFPPIITIIDVGQATLVFLVGFMQSYAFRKRVINWGNKAAWVHVFNRFGLLLGLGVIFEDFILSKGIFAGFCDGTLALLAWASLISGFVTYLNINKKKLLLFGSAIFFIHAILYAFPTIRNFSVGNGLNTLYIPWRMINLCAISIIATSYSIAIFDENGEILKESFRTWILPISTIFFILNFIIDYMQWADQYHCTTALATLAIAIDGWALFLFYKFEEEKFQIPWLSSLGKNMWMVLIVSPLFEWLWIALLKDVIRSNIFFGLLLGGLIPLLFIILIAKVLEKKKIYFKL